MYCRRKGSSRSPILCPTGPLNPNLGLRRGRSVDPCHVLQRPWDLVGIWTRPKPGYLSLHITTFAPHTASGGVLLGRLPAGGPAHRATVQAHATHKLSVSGATVPLPIPKLTSLPRGTTSLGDLGHTQPMCALLRKMHKCVRHTVPRWAILRLGATPNRRSGGTGITTMIVWNGPMLNSASCHGDMSHYYHESV